MSLFDIVLLAIALGIDCMLASFSQGLIFTGNRVKNSLALAVSMCIFQGGMPIIGYIGANYISELVAPFSKWITFAIFAVLGIKFILESFQKEKENICCIGLKCLVSLGIATSIDALVSGASLNFSNTSLPLACIIIGAASFIMSLFGFWFGNMLKKFPSNYLELLGGLILIFLAIKTIII